MNKYMKYSCNFEKPFSKRRIVFASIIGFIFIFSLGLFIASSWYSVDDKVATVGFKWTENKILRGWAAWTVLDGWSSEMPFFVPLCVLILLSPWKYAAVKNPKSKAAKSWRYHYFLDAVGGVIFLGITTWISFYAILADQGFGFAKMSVEFIFGRKFLFTVFGISLAVQTIIYCLLMWYIEIEVMNDRRFIERRVWRQALIVILFFIYSRIVLGILKSGFGRPYWYDIHFTDTKEENGIMGPLERVEEWYGNDLWNHYVNGQNKVNWGWGGADGNKLSPWGGLKEIPWWKPTNGFFSSLPDKNLYPKQTAFPSGHMAHTITGALTGTVLFFNYKGNKKGNIIRNVIAVLLIGYSFDMAAALLISTSHWLSDITFIVVISPAIYIASWATINGILNSINKRNKSKVL